MDSYLLKAAVLYALSATSHTVTALDEFLQDASFANTDLDPLTYELFDLRTPLERLGDSDLVIPPRLLPPILAIVRSCGDAVSRIDAVLRDCAEGPLREARWIARVPEVQELKIGLQTSRRALQLAIEVVNLAAAKDTSTDANTFTTYLDQDTSQVLALIRRTLQQVRESDRKDALNLTLRTALDETRLYVQSLCRTGSREETKTNVLPVTMANKQANKQHHEDASTTVTNEPASPEEETPAPLITGLRPAKKLTSAFARWSLSSPRNSTGNSLASSLGSMSQPSSATSSSRMQADDKSSVTSSSPQTSRHPSDISHRSQSSFASSGPCRGSGVLSASSVRYGLLPPTSPPSNPRRSASASVDESIAMIPSSLTPFDCTSTPSESPTLIGRGFMAGPLISQSPSIHTALPSFALNLPDKIIIDPSDIPIQYRQRSPAAIDIVRSRVVSFNEKGSGHSVNVFSVDMSPSSYILSIKHGDRTIKIHGLPQCNLQSSLKINFYVKMQQRSRDFFVTSHAILSETRNLIAFATGFGHSLEIWNWARKKKLQTIESAIRWAAAKTEMYGTNFSPLACYREDGDTIDLYAVIKDSSSDSKGSARKPFAKPTVIDLGRAGLPHIPKLPEMAYSTTAPLLVAAAGPRSPRAGHPPPEHSAMLMVWELDTNPDKQSSRPCRFSMPKHEELETALPCGIATHGSIVVSIWIPSNVRVIGRPKAWQVVPVAVHERHVLVWNFATGSTDIFPIPDENTIACISPDCRFVAYRHGPGAETGRARNSLVILDALNGGKEMWRTPTFGGGKGLARGNEQLLDVSRVTSISFSSDSGLFLVGDAGGSVGVYEVRGGNNEEGLNILRR